MHRPGAYEQALERWKTSGYVRQGDAAILGVPAGTPTADVSYKNARSRCSDGRTATAADFFKPRLSEKINHLCAQGTEVIYDKEMKM